MPIVKQLQSICLFFLLLIYGIFVTQKINLVTADLGRHFKNGEIIVKTFSVPRTNFYSYTFADFPFVNHHWGSGVIFYLIKRFFGFTGLSVFFVLISLATFWLFFDVARKSSRFSIVALASIFVLPVLAARIEIRPEIFSYLFCGLFFWLLWQVKNKLISSKWLYLIPVLELLWINLHIYFFLGFVILGVFFIDSLIDKTKILKSLCLAKVGILGLILSLINPAGVSGVLYPFKIFRSYGYRLFENQPVWFLDKIVSYPPSFYFKIVFAGLVLSWFFVFLKRRNFSFVLFVFSFLLSFSAWIAVRNFTLFGYFTLPVLAINLKDLFKAKETTPAENFLAASLVVFILFGYFIVNPSYWVGRVSPGVGLEEKHGRAAEFFLANRLAGPIFNNYDNGGYLIYFLYPQKVFVDNRPEAYPKDFFQETYIPMQENNEKWQQVEGEYRFNTIFFYRHDLTPWGQNFLVNRIRDPAWAPIYVDDWSLIFVRRNEENKEIIKKFELPKEMFYF